MITLPYNQLYRFIDNIMAGFEASSYKTLEHYLLDHDTYCTIKDLNEVDVQLGLQCNENYTPVLVIGNSEYILEEVYQSLSSLKTSASGHKSVCEFLQYGDYSLFEFYLSPKDAPLTLAEFDGSCNLDVTTGCVRNACVAGRDRITVVDLPELNNRGE